jgi:3-deoxy-manno-octulosonate cytidylyltransferase (CMP-KDO synthetase)
MIFAGIIPARYASTRFPGKPLVDIKGKSMIERVYIQASKALEHVYVATDDDRIEAEVKRFGGKVIMTSPDHQSGTDRVAEALDQIQRNKNIHVDVVLNIQGDEPFIQPLQLEKLMGCFADPHVDIATLAKAIHENEDVFNPNVVKVVTSNKGKALYFSRSPIPYVRNKPVEQWSNAHTYYKHLGIYAYRTAVLREITRLPQSLLELSESLEQLRWLENGYTIMVKHTDFESIAIDTPDDLKRLENFKTED